LRKAIVRCESAGFSLLIVGADVGIGPYRVHLTV